MVTTIFKADANFVLKKAGLEVNDGYCNATHVAEALAKKNILLQQSVEQLKILSAAYMKNEPNPTRRAEMSGVMEGLIETIEENDHARSAKSVGISNSTTQNNNVVQLFRR
jgi:hypothetical protein